MGRMQQKARPHVLTKRRRLVNLPSGIGHSVLVFFLVIPLALETAVFITGCGGQPSGPPGNGQDAGISTAVEEGEAATKDTLVSEDLPAAIGTRLEFAANDAGTPVKVSFDLEGPWDFTFGPDSSTLTITVIAKETAPLEDRFPEATIAARSSWTPSPSQVEYNFQDIDESSWKAFGRSGQGDRLVIYSSPSRALMFPAAVGQRWSDTYIQSDDNKSVEITADNLIVSLNTLTVPAGTFEAYLLQTRITATEDGAATTAWDYIWLVPGIGRAAEIISRPGEAREVFDSAYAFYRLKNY